MRYAIVADIHGNVIALKAVLDDLGHRGVDRIINLGDCVSGPLWPSETAELLIQLDWPTVRGNHDRWVTEWPLEKHYASDAFAFRALSSAQLAWLRGLPASLELGDGILACHGRPEDDNAYLLEDIDGGRLVVAPNAHVLERVRSVAARFVLCGHSHIPGAMTVDDKVIINPGSVGQPAYEDPTEPVHVSESGSPFARYAVLDIHAGRTTFEHVAVLYDHLAAARRAEENNSPAWAHLLATGFVRRRL
jgi:predicted phosphodiesterase